jgi:hypothetical protein
VNFASMIPRWQFEIHNVADWGRGTNWERGVHGARAFGLAVSPASGILGKFGSVVSIGKVQPADRFDKGVPASRATSTRRKRIDSSQVQVCCKTSDYGLMLARSCWQAAC